MSLINDIIESLLQLEQICLKKSSKSTVDDLIIKYSNIIENFNSSIELSPFAEIKLALSKNNIENCRYDLILYVVKLLEIIQIVNEHSNQLNSLEVECTKQKKNETPTKLISLQELKAIKYAVQYIFYSIILDCLEKEASTYFYLNIANKKCMFNGSGQFDGDGKYELMGATTKFLLHLIQIEGYGEEIWKSYSAEFISTLLQLCFSPLSLKGKVFFKAELGNVMQTTDNFLFLQQLLMLKNIQWSKGSNWFGNCCSSIIYRKYVMKPGGINLVIRIGMQNDDSPDWKKKEAIARIVTLSNVKDSNVYFESIGKQVVELASEIYKKLDVLETNKLNTNILHICGFIIEQLVERNKKLSEEIIFKNLLSPLIHLLKGSEPSHINEVNDCICLLHKLYVETMSPNSHLHSLIEPVLVPIVKISLIDSILYVITHIKSLSQHIIIRYLSQLSDNECVSVLMVLSELECQEHIPQFNKATILKLFDDKIINDKSTGRDLLEEDDRIVKYVVVILEKLLNSKVTRLYFKNLSKYIHFSTNKHDNKSDDKYLLTEVCKIERNCIYFRTLSKVASLLSCIADHEKLMADLFGDLEFLQEFLNHLLLSMLQQSDDEKIANIQESLQLNIVMLLFTYLSGISSNENTTRSDWNILNRLIPTLTLIKTSTTNVALSDILNELIELITTHRTISDKSSKSKENPSTKYKEALNDLNSPYLPVKGHGIIALTRLIKCKDPEAINKIDKILLLFKYHLKNEDSYIYLAAIEGIATLCDLFPDETVPLLTKEFTEKQELSVETRLKIIECLTKATERLGDMLPKYRNHFINSLLSGCRDQDELIRASSLSNLGEVCKHLRFSLGPIVTEILTVVYDAIMWQKSPSVRRAGVLVLTLILRGIDKSVFKVLNDILLQIYRFLKNLRRDTDEVVRLHAAIAMEEIDDIAKSFLIPKINMTKKIYVTELPPTTF